MPPTVNFKDTVRIFNLMLMLLRVYDSCVGCILVAGRKENSSRLWLMCTGCGTYLCKKPSFVGKPICQWDVQSVGCNSCCCCVLSAGNHLLANGPQGKCGTLEHFPAPRQDAQLEGDLAARPWCLTATAWSCQQGRGLPHGSQIRGLTLAHSFNSSAGRCSCPTTAWKPIWEALLVSSEEPQAPGSTAWKSQWELPSVEGTIFLTQESVFWLRASVLLPVASTQQCFWLTWKDID